jgi:hypothetical protein
VGWQAQIFACQKESSQQQRSYYHRHYFCQVMAGAETSVTAQKGQTLAPHALQVPPPPPFGRKTQQR